MSKRAHRNRVRGNPCGMRKWILGKTTIGTRQYINNKREEVVKSVFSEGEVFEKLFKEKKDE